MNAPVRPALAQPTATRNASAGDTFRELLDRPYSRSFDPEAFHVMSDRDNALIADEILNGSGSSKFVYAFNIAGTNVTGISVVGARHLAAEYGGLRHRIVASTRKVGSLFTFTSYPHETAAMNVSCSTIPDLRDEDDFYSALVELTDIKKGNSIQMEASETRQERRRDGTPFDRPHYQKIAQAKAYRNAILALIPQDVQIAWREKMLALGKGETITGSVIDEKRTGILQFAAAKGIPMDRHAIEALTMAQIAGLAEAARTKDAAQFANAALALGLVQEAAPIAEDEGATAAEKRKPGRPAKQPAPPASAEPPRAEAPSTPQGAATTGAATDPNEPPPPSGEELF